MNIADLVDIRNINLNVSVSCKDDLFNAMAEQLEKTGFIKNKRKFVKDLYKREKEASTGIEEGFAIPHAKSKQVLRPTIAISKTTGIKDYETFDGSPVQWVFMLAVPENNSSVHLEILSYLARKLLDENFKKNIKSATTEQQVLDLLSNKEVI